MIENTNINSGNRSLNKAKYSLERLASKWGVGMFLMVFGGVFFFLPHSTQAATVTWTGAGADNNWSTSGNWTGGTGVPTSSDAVVFSGDTGTYPNADKDTTWDSSGPATVGSVDFQAGYAGNVTISKATVTVNGNWTWAGTGSFDAGTSTLKFGTTTCGATFTPGSVSYYNLDIALYTGCHYTFTVSGTLTLSNNFTLSTQTTSSILNLGTTNVGGNVNIVTSTVSTGSGSGTLVLNGTNDQTITGSGGNIEAITINKSSGAVTLSGTVVVGSWVWTSGTVLTSGTSTLMFFDANCSSASFTPGNVTYYNVTLSPYSGCHITYTVSGTANVTNNFTVTSATGNTIINGGTINVGGNLSATTATAGSTGTVNLVLNGAGSQTISTSGYVFPAITINKPSGVLTLSGTIPIVKNWTHTKGTIDPGSSTLSFTASSTFTPGSASYNHITLGTGGITLTVSGTATVLGNLTVSASSAVTLNTGTLNIYGDVSISGAGGTSGTGTVQIGGSGAQTLSSTGGGPLSNITINKPSGILTTSGTVPIIGSWIWTAGELNASTSNMKFTGFVDGTVFTPGNVEYYDVELARQNNYYFTVSGTATITHNLVISQTLSALIQGGNLDVKGDVSMTSSTAAGGTATIRIVGTGTQTLSSAAGGIFPNITINKPSGTLTLSGTIRFGGNWTWTAGKLDAGTSTLQMGYGSNGMVFTPGNGSYYNLELTQINNYYTALGGNLIVTNNLSITSASASGAFQTSGYTVTVKNIVMNAGYGLDLGSSVVKLSGNFTHSGGTFTAGTSTVILNGTNQTISGTTTFYNLYKLLPDATTDTLTFTAGTTYTIASGGTARFIGTRGYPLSVQSSSAGSAFTLTKTGNVIAEYVSLKDCTVSSATSAPASTNVSGNTNWTFTKEFVSTIRATGGDYTTLSSWESALGTVDLTSAATKVFAHGGITGTIADNTAVTGATSGATGTAVHTTSTQILIKSITGTFQSGEQIRVNVSNYVTSSDTGNGAIAVAEAYNDWPNALNDSVTISGETTDADNFILITVPASQQHGGKLKDTASNYYRGFTLKPSASTAIVLDNQQSYTRITGVAVDGTNATATNIRLNGTSPFATRLLSAGGVDGISLSGGAIVLNSLARDGTGKCFEDTTSATTHYTVYNSTARGCAYGFHGDNTTTAITLKNCLASANTTADFALTNTGAKSVTYSASSDATADDFGTTTGDRVSQTFTFIDATNKDFHLAPKDAGARNYGLDLLSDSTYPITKDIDNDVRPTVNPNDSSEVSYDIGADEADYDTVRSGDGVILKDGVRLK